MNRTPQSAVPARRGVLTLFAVALLATATACGSLAPIPPRAPTLAFSTLRMASVGRDNLRLEIVVDCGNPNDFDVPVSALRFDLDLLGAPFAHASALEEPLTLPAHSSRPVPIEIDVSTADFRKLVRRLRPADLAGLEYHVKGTVRWGALGLSIPFERSGRIPILRSPREPAR